MARKNLIGKCCIKGCERDKKHVRCWNAARTNFWTCVGKFCSMHYERKRKRGSPGKAEAEINRGKAWLTENGYLKISFYGEEVYVHRLVDALTHGPIPKNWDVHHKDENKLNNHWDNLQRMPHQEHMELHANCT